MSTKRRVVITGIGMTSPVGGTTEESWQALLAGRSGVRTLTEDWVTKHELPVTFAATVHTSPAEVLARVEVRRNDPDRKSVV